MHTSYAPSHALFLHGNTCTASVAVMGSESADQSLLTWLQAAPHLVKAAASKPVHDSEDSFIELTHRPEPRVKMSMYALHSRLKSTASDRGFYISLSLDFALPVVPGNHVTHQSLMHCGMCLHQGLVLLPSKDYVQTC